MIAVVDEPQVLVAVLGEQRVGLERVDLVAEEQVRDLAVVAPRLVVPQPPGVVLEQQRGAPDSSIWSWIVLPSRGSRPSVSHSSSPSSTSPQPASKM